MRTSRLRVAVDATALLGVRTGVARVTAGLIEHLAAQDDVEVVAYAITWRGRRRLAEVLPPTVTPATRPFPARLARLLWARLPVPRVESWTGSVDVAHATNYVAPPARAPVLLTVHDLSFLRFPELVTEDARTYLKFVRRALDRRATVHADSEFVASEVRSHFGVDSKRVVAIYPGLAPAIAGDRGRGHALADAERYVLALGTVEPRKNLPGLVRAFEAIAHDRRDVALVVAGPDGWGVDAYRQAVAEARHGDRIRRLGFVSDGDRAALMAGASALAYPSLYEGFGYPALEAMQVGVPVVASCAGALPEVLGDAALLPDPHDEDALAEALALVLDDDDERARLSRLGLERASRYTWERAVAGFVTAYRGLADGALG